MIDVRLKIYLSIMETVKKWSLKSGFMMSLVEMEFSLGFIPAMKRELASSHAQNTASPS